MGEAGKEALREIAKQLGGAIKTLSDIDRVRLSPRSRPHPDFAWLETTVDGLRAAVFVDVRKNVPFFGLAVFTPNATVSSIAEPTGKNSAPHPHFRVIGGDRWRIDRTDDTPLKLERYIFVGCRDGVLYATPWSLGVAYGAQEIAIATLPELAALATQAWRPPSPTESASERAAERKNIRYVLIGGLVAFGAWIAQALLQ